jgi:hypothetical protein
MTNGAQYGIIRGIAQVWIEDRWLFRILVLMKSRFTFIYIGASNYRFRYGDIVSWTEDRFYWHAQNQTVRFDLMQKEGVKQTGC